MLVFLSRKILSNINGITSLCREIYHFICLVTKVNTTWFLASTLADIVIGPQIKVLFYINEPTVIANFLLTMFDLKNNNDFVLALSFLSYI